ncbi:antitoxin Xre/MbcA/ParS toxin-binding domain-containing protein [Brevundimonas aurifodinae]|uniref:Antitoxin Xre/MbcA/ParS toxin-binding domain-containing protein n=2 Tax=Brevundimonas TaxID=41275 RepID=A0ABV1NSA8_9CAUL|nr:MAG: hypothetical protein B7Z42_11985 [Brevundimonas sp. 12-68-7]OYX30773.1 MAG: hypothetical protein B7Z01_13765 [Brevundimonas subvibrioides]
MSAEPLTFELEPDYVTVYRSTPMERISLVKRGVSAVYARRVMAALWDRRDAGYEALNLAPATMNRKVARQQALSPDEGERVLGLAKLIGQVEAIVSESGSSPDFDASAWLSEWLNEPVAALGGRKPVELLDTLEGQALVSDTLGRMQSGAYA